MDKESAANYSAVLADVPTALRSLAAERDHYMAKCAAMERHHEADKLAKVAHDKGVYLEHEHEELIEHFEKEAAAGKLPEIRRALDMVAPNMGQKLAHVSDERSVGAGHTDFERYIHGEIG